MLIILLETYAKCLSLHGLYEIYYSNMRDLREKKVRKTLKRKKKKATVFWNIKIQKRLAHRSFLRKRHSQYKKRVRNKSKLGLSKVQREERNYKQKLWDYNHIKAPANLSLIENCENTLDFLKKIRVCFDKRKKVFVVLKHVTNISHDAIVVLLANLVQFKANKIDFNGDFPTNKSARDVIEKSGFFSKLYDRFNVQDEYELKSPNNSIYTHAQKTVNPELTDKLIQYASETVWGSSRRCIGVQRVFLELMQNTNNHAAIGVEGDKHWWVSVNHCKNKKIVSFSFIDFGVGVFNSLKGKPQDSKFYRILDKLAKAISPHDNAELLKSILRGELHHTATGKYYRGKGLPGIYDALKQNSMSNLFIITNDAFVDASNDKYIPLKNELLGTFVYWELNENNKNLPWIE